MTIKSQWEYELRLRIFAKSVLNTLETEKDWGADVLYEIAQFACDIDLAESDDDWCYFKRKLYKS